MPWKLAAVCSLVLFVSTAVFAESRYSLAVRQTLTAAYAQKDQDGVIDALVEAAAKAASADDRKAILSSLADYEERSGLLSAASKHYNDAAFADPKARDDGLLLDASRCAFVSGDTSSADGFVRAVLLTCFDEKTLVRARVYSAWIILYGGSDSQNGPGSPSSAPSATALPSSAVSASAAVLASSPVNSPASALSLIHSYAENPSFAAYAPALLFTLWWSSGDADAKSKLLSSFPGSPEASVVRGDMSLSPTPFWYLMARDPSKVAAFANAGTASLAAATASDSPASGGSPATDSATADRAGSGSGNASDKNAVADTSFNSDKTADSGKGTASSGKTSVQADKAGSGSSSGIWQQAGFFRSRDNAEDLRSRLAKLGFKAVVREEKRPSGTVYFSVLVPGDAKGATAARLKDAGFESYLVTD